MGWVKGGTRATTALTRKLRCGHLEKVRDASIDVGCRKRMAGAKRLWTCELHHERAVVGWAYFCSSVCRDRAVSILRAKE